MKTNYRKRHAYHPHVKAERALTMAVLLALQAGTMAGPAFAEEKEKVVSETITNESVAFNGNDDESLSNNKITIAETGKVTYTGDPPSNNIWDVGVIAVYAKDNTTATATGNWVSILGEVQVPAYGAYVGGKATGNYVELSGNGKAYELCGAYAALGATSNTANILGGTITKNAYGGRADTGAATENTVTIAGCTIQKDAYGGFSDKGEATKNTVEIKGGTVQEKAFGGYSAKGKATENQLELTDGTAQNAIGGYSDASTAEKNKLTMTGDTITQNAYGGYSDKGEATQNTVEITGGTAQNAFGGYSNASTAKNNKLTMTGGTNTSNAYGGYSNSGTATANELTITKDAISTNAYGGYSEAGAATSNTVNIEGGSIAQNAYGGCSGSTNEVTITGNTVNITGGTITEGRAYGGYSAGKGTVKDNIVNITGGEIKSSQFVNSCAAVGGYSSEGEATGNKLTIAGDSKLTGCVIGGWSSQASASGNHLKITGGTITGLVCGGRGGGYGDNTVEISGGTITGDVVGGRNIWFIDSDVQKGIVQGNTVTITGGTITGNVIGGNSSFCTYGNTVTITGGTVGGNVCGGWGNSDSGKKGNTVEISGGTITKDVNGGLGHSSTPDGNTVILHASAEQTFASDSSIIGSKYTGDYVSYGNTLELDQLKGVTIGNIEYFHHYQFILPEDTKADDSILTLTKSESTFLNRSNKGTSEVKVEVKNPTLLDDLDNGDVIYLLKKEGDGTLSSTAGTTLPTLKDVKKENDKKTASDHTKVAVTQQDNDLVLKKTVTYDYTINSDTKKDDVLLTSDRTLKTTITGDDVNVHAEAGQQLALNKGDSICLLQNTTAGELAYSGTRTLKHTYTTQAAGAGTATVTTTGTVGTKGNDLMLNVDKVAYAFDLTKDTKKDDVLLTSTNMGATQIDLNDVDVKADADPVTFQKGDQVYLVQKTNGTLACDGTKDVGFDRKNLNTAGTAYFATAATVKQAGNDLVLAVGGQKYFFTLSPAVQGGC